MPYTPGRDGTLVLESVPDVGEAATIPFDEKPRTSHVESEPSAHWMHCMHLGAVSTGMVLMELVPSCSQWNVSMLAKCSEGALWAHASPDSKHAGGQLQDGLEATFCPCHQHTVQGIVKRELVIAGCPGGALLTNAASECRHAIGQLQDGLSSTCTLPSTHSA